MKCPEKFRIWSQMTWVRSIRSVELQVIILCVMYIVAIPITTKLSPIFPEWKKNNSQFIQSSRIISTEAIWFDLELIDLKLLSEDILLLTISFKWLLDEFFIYIYIIQSLRTQSFQMDFFYMSGPMTVSLACYVLWTKNNPENVKLIKSFQ